jgi:purine/pyrimidine-nucleoside phosphorylase
MEFRNAVVKKQANVYHGGQVTSRSVITADGEMKTLGIMLPGVYRFNTEAPEIIDVTQGRCRVRIGDESEWREYAAGETFHIPGNSHFEIEVTELVDYLCHFG